MIRIYISRINYFLPGVDFFVQPKAGHGNGFPDNKDNHKNDSIIIAAVKNYMSIAKRKLCFSSFFKLFLGKFVELILEGR